MDNPTSPSPGGLEPEQAQPQRAPRQLLSQLRDGLGRAGRSFTALSWPRRLLAATAVLLFGLGVVVPVLGLSDELLAMTGEQIFRVAPLPDIDAPKERTRLLDRNGTEIGVLTGPENRVVVSLDAVPDHLVDAVLATEDRRFFEHEGVSVAGILRAVVRNVVAGGVEQGGSTITQQYVKNALLTAERSFSRKITEATWAVRVEERLSKDEILSRYLDIVYLGDGTYGVGAAANYWFNKDVRQLTLEDSALLAGMIRAPEATNPAQEPEVAQQRRDIVLTQMVDVGAITQDEADEAAAIDVTDQLEVTPLAGPEHGFFTEYVKQVLLADEALGDDRDERAELIFGGGLTIHTTLDVELQRHAEATLATHLTDPVADPMGGVVSVEPATGAVVAMAVGPKAFGICAPDHEGPCDRTTVNPLVPGLGSAGRQVGSAFKPIIVAAALAGGTRTDWHTIVDSGQAIPGCGNYRPQNYDNSNGVEDMTSALAESNNVFHVKLGVDTGLEDVVELAGKLGVTNSLEPNCSLALGSAEVHPLDMAVVYATFANRGVHCAPMVVSEVVARDGSVLVTGEPTCERALDEDVADTVTTMLRGVVEGGTGRRASIGRPVAAKTGTTNDNLDAWLVGFTPELATATWVGFEVPEPMTNILGYRSISGGTLPAVLWAEFMEAALEDTESGDLPRLRVSRYSTPPCPPPPAPAPAPSPDQAPENDGVVAPAPQTSPTPTPPSGSDPEGDPEYEGFNPQDGTLLTETDGDDFAGGHQPERCVMSAPPEAYTRPAPTGPSPDPSSSPTSDPSTTPTDEPTQSPSPSPSPTPSPSPSPSPTPSDEPSPEPSPTPDGPGDEPPSGPA